MSAALALSSSGIIHLQTRISEKLSSYGKRIRMKPSNYIWSHLKLECEQRHGCGKLFRSIVNFSEDLCGWNTSAVTKMGRLFSSTTNFAADVSTWDTSKVTDIISLFQNTTNFASDVSAWDTSKVILIRWLFAETSTS